MSTETSPRQMHHARIYRQARVRSDAFQQNGEEFTFPQTVWELAYAVDQERLAVDRFFMMHIGPAPWSDALQTIATAKKVPAT